MLTQEEIDKVCKQDGTYCFPATYPDHMHWCLKRIVFATVETGRNVAVTFTDLATLVGWQCREAFERFDKDGR